MTARRSHRSLPGTAVRVLLACQNDHVRAGLKCAITNASFLVCPEHQCQVNAIVASTSSDV